MSNIFTDIASAVANTMVKPSANTVVTPPVANTVVVPPVAPVEIAPQDPLPEVVEPTAEAPAETPVVENDQNTDQFDDGDASEVGKEGTVIDDVSDGLTDFVDGVGNVLEDIFNQPASTPGEEQANEGTSQQRDKWKDDAFGGSGQ